jgi:hypothetical protein
MAERAKTRTRRHVVTPRADGDHPPTYLQLAGDALLAGTTREQAIAGLISRIKRDQGYLAYREACHRHTRYDEEVIADLRALALAAVLLGEEGTQHGDEHERAGQRVGARPRRPLRSRWDRR